MTFCSFLLCFKDIFDSDILFPEIVSPRKHYLFGFHAVQFFISKQYFCLLITTIQNIYISNETSQKEHLRNTGTGNGMPGTQGMGGMLYSGECCQTFRGMLLNIPGNVLKHSGECCQTFPGMSSNILRNVAKHSGEYRQTLRGMSSNIPDNVIKNSGERRQTFQGMFLISRVKGRVAFRILSNIHEGALLRK